MSLTNIQAFQVYCKSSPALAELVLTNKSIVPTASDALEVSGAWGMIELAKIADWSQGSTKESLSASARSLLISEARAILNHHGISYQTGNIPTVRGIQW